METPKVGRPRKEEPVLSHSAVGTYQDPATLRWHVVKISYDPSTGSTGKAEVVATEHTRADLEYAFKITVANLDLIG